MSPHSFCRATVSLKHIEVDKDEQTRSLPAMAKRRNKLERCGLCALLPSEEILKHVEIGKGADVF